MSREKAQSKIERIAEAFVISGGVDAETLADIQHHFTELQAWAEAENHGDAADQVHTAQAVIEELLAGKAIDNAVFVQRLDEVIRNLQEMLEEEGAPEAMFDLAIDKSLLETFISEASEHLDAAEAHLLCLEKKDNDKQALDGLFRAFHTIKGSSSYLDFTDLQNISHEMESMLDLARSGKLSLGQEPLTIIFEGVDLLKSLLDSVKAYVHSGEQAGADPAVPGFLKRVKSWLERGADETPVSDDEGEGFDTFAEAPLEEEELASAKGAENLDRYAYRTGGEVKVKADRLDGLLDAIGELVIAESMVALSPQLRGLASGELERQLRQLDKITRSLQEMSTSLRMMPVRPVFVKMARLVRDLSLKSNKAVHFSYSGEDTELDKAVIDRIGDPLVHLLRNAIDHGLEANSAEREKAGKPAKGQIALKAFHRGGNIFLEVSDDGRGMDVERIRQLGIERGLIDEADTLPEEEILALIFEPGFSTASKVTEISGRGVGMDAVKAVLEELRGNVQVHSRPGEGTTISLILPLTVAIIDGMQTRVGWETYIIPTLSIIESFRPTPEMLTRIAGRGLLVTFRGTQLPLFSLARLFGVARGKADPTEGLVVVVEDAGRKIALQVDELLGQQQTVIKSLGEGLGKVAGISGASILADGKPGLILDIPGLVRLASRGEMLEEAAPEEEPDEDDAEILVAEE